MIVFSDIEKNDTNSMYKTYDNWPKIAKDAYEANLKQVTFEKTDHIVFAGMGGSGAIGDMFASLLSKTKIHVNVVKGYLLPKTVDANTLVVIVSVSGNTIETLSVLKTAKKLECKIIAFSAGGKIQEYCTENGINHIFVPKYHSPRATFPSYLYTILKVLHHTLKIKQEDITESIEKLEILNKKINSLNLTTENPALNLAKWITMFPIIYYPFGLQSAAIRFKNSLQENAKIHTASEDVIEACHNGIVAWEKNSNVQPILIRGKEDNVKTKERWEILKRFFQEKNIEFKENAIKNLAKASLNGSLLAFILKNKPIPDNTEISINKISRIRLSLPLKRL